MQRKLEGPWPWLVRITAIAFSVFQLYTAGFGSLQTLEQRSVHVGFGTVIVFALYSTTKRKGKHNNVPLWDLALVALTIFFCAYVFVNQLTIMTQIQKPATLGLVLGAIAIPLLVEASRRTMGWVFPVMTVIGILYAFFGKYVPGTLGHRGLSLNHMLSSLYLSDVGMWNYVTGISATIIAAFIIFGQIMLLGGGGQTFVNIGLKAAGRIPGAGGLVAVIASALFGTISGSGIANTATCGNFTIPLMKRLGYRPEFAAGVEATASTGGQITPPVLGSGAFLMAELLGIPYMRIVVASIIPCFLYYLGLFTSVFFYAGRHGLGRVPKEDIPPLKEILKWSSLAPFALPLIILVVLLVNGFTPEFSVFFSIVAAILIYVLSPSRTTPFLQRIKTMVLGLESGGIALAGLVPLIVCSAILVNLVGLTGFGVKFSGLIVGLSQDFILVPLLIGAFVNLALGAPLPTVAAYLLAVTITGPGILKLDVVPLALHFFMFYYSILGMITPPVCADVYVAAVIAKANWLKAAWESMRMAIVLTLMPFVFVLKPQLLLVNPTWANLAWLLASLIVATVLLSAGSMGFFVVKLKMLPRVAFLIAGFGLFGLAMFA